MYNLGGFDLLTGGTIPIRQSDSNVALTGFLDMPSRIGKTEHDWAGEIGVEPYVLASEIFFGGRTIEWNGLVTGIDQYEINYKLAAIYDAIDGFTGLVPFITPYGTYQVYVNAAIVGEYMPDAGSVKGVKLTIPMREPVVDMTGTIPTSTSSEFGIDGVSFADLGGEFLQLEGDRRNRTAPKSETASVYGREVFLITKRTAGELILKLGIKQPTIEELQGKAADLTALFAAPGLRSLTVNNDRLRSFFVKDGFKATKINITEDWAFCLIECVLTESGLPGTFTELVDALGDIVTNNEDDVIMVRI